MTSCWGSEHAWREPAAPRQVMEGLSPPRCPALMGTGGKEESALLSPALSPLGIGGQGILHGQVMLEPLEGLTERGLDSRV